METKAQREYIAQITQLVCTASVHTQILLTPKFEQLNTKLYSALINWYQCTWAM